MKHKPARSRWFPGSQDPWEIGIYERRDQGGFLTMNKWDGTWWLVRYGHTWSRSVYQYKRWRGLAEKPK